MGKKSIGEICSLFIVTQYTCCRILDQRSLFGKFLGHPEILPYWFYAKLSTSLTISWVNALNVLNHIIKLVVHVSESVHHNK